MQAAAQLETGESRSAYPVGLHAHPRRDPPALVCAPRATRAQPLHW